MKKWILPACLIAVGLIAFVFGYLHGNSTISKQNAEQIITDYITKNYPAYYDPEKYEVPIANIDLDLFSIVAGDQKWRVFTIWPQGWFAINAYTGKIEDEYFGFYEWVTQSGNRFLFSDFLPIAMYILVILFACLYSKNVTIKVLFYVSAALFLLSFPISTAISAIYNFFIAT